MSESRREFLRKIPPRLLGVAAAANLALNPDTARSQALENNEYREKFDISRYLMESGTRASLVSESLNLREYLDSLIHTNQWEQGPDSVPEDAYGIYNIGSREVLLTCNLTFTDVFERVGNSHIIRVSFSSLRRQEKLSVVISLLQVPNNFFKGRSFREAALSKGNPLVKALQRDNIQHDFGVHFDLTAINKEFPAGTLTAAEVTPGGLTGIDVDALAKHGVPHKFRHGPISLITLASSIETRAELRESSQKREVIAFLRGAARGIINSFLPQS